MDAPFYLCLKKYISVKKDKNMGTSKLFKEIEGGKPSGKQEKTSDSESEKKNNL